MNLSFSKLGNHGRLGNQLFQIAGTLGLAEIHKATASFPAWKYQQYFEKPLPHGNMEAKQVQEQHFHHYDWQITESCDIVGYLQTEKYFPKNIKEQFRFAKPFIDQVRRKAPFFDRETIAIQIRRGDYVGHQGYYQLKIHYFIQALIEHFPNWQECNIVFISDDMDYCRVHFECLPNAKFTDGFSDIEHLCLMSQCNNHIISNSSYGWWGAYLSEGKKVVHPGVMFTGTLADKDIKDYYPKSWVCHQKKKIDLSDTTFTIPVFHDHNDRKKNLDLSLCMLQQSFNAKFIIGEQGSNQFGYTEAWAKYHYFIELKQFHRTKMLNQMALMAETEIIVNWDCDVIIPPMQVYLAVLALRNGADMVFPYDGRFARMPRQNWFSQIEKRLDIGIVGNTQFKGKQGNPLPITSVGGAVLFNKDSFIDGGMENEYFISFGPEDCERNDRFKKLGYKVERTGGCLYHMDHWVGLNSSTNHPHFKQNKVEYDKVHDMDKEHLLDYVDTWPWRHKYTASYYKRISEGSARSAKHVFEALKKIGVNPKSVLDVGCGAGAWVQPNIKWVGIDSGIPKKALFEGVEYLECDLGKLFDWQQPSKEKEVSEVIYRKAELTICLEVVEHLPIQVAKNLVKYLTLTSEKILFSAAIPNQGGTGHVNEQWQSHWEKLFNDNGFGAAEKQPDIRNNPEIEMYYRQNIVLYEKGGKGKVQDFVLPEYYEQIVGHWKNQVK